VTIIDCGELSQDEKYTRESAPFIAYFDKFPFETEKDLSDEEAEARFDAKQAKEEESKS